MRDQQQAGIHDPRRRFCNDENVCPEVVDLRDELDRCRDALERIVETVEIAASGSTNNAARICAHIAAEALGADQGQFSPEFMASIREGLRQADAGQTVSFEEVFGESLADEGTDPPSDREGT